MNRSKSVKSNVYCSVFNCNIYYSEDKSISFHWFPKENEGNVPWKNKYGLIENIDKRRAWTINLRIDKKSLKKKLKVCSKHFTNDDFHKTTPGVTKVSRRLLKTAKPTKNLPKSVVDKYSPTKRPSTKKRLPLKSSLINEGKSQFTKSEDLLTKEIASARVHIERVNQRLKVFKVLQNKFCWGHVHLAYDILIIISGVCNLSPLIFSSHKFI